MEDGTQIQLASVVIHSVIVVQIQLKVVIQSVISMKIHTSMLSRSMIVVQIHASMVRRMVNHLQNRKLIKILGTNYDSFLTSISLLFGDRPAK
jgi:hypothetical protein